MSVRRSPAVHNGPEPPVYQSNRTPEINRGTNDYRIGVRPIDRLLQFRNLLFTVAHGRKDIGKVAVPGEGLDDTAHGVGAGSTSSAAPYLLAAMVPAPYAMLPWVRVGPSSTTKTRLPAKRPGWSIKMGEAALNDGGFWVDQPDIGPNLVDILRVTGFDFIDEQDIGHAEVGFTRMIA